MKLLITGAAGRIGTVLRAGLREEMDELRLSDRVEPPDLAAAETFVAADLADAAAVDRAVAGVDARQLAEPRRIQGFDVTGAGAVFDSVPHFRGHTQEIVHMTRSQLGDAYRFAWRPATPEQGAPA